MRTSSPCHKVYAINACAQHGVRSVARHKTTRGHSKMDPTDGGTSEQTETYMAYSTHCEVGALEASAPGVWVAVLFALAQHHVQMHALVSLSERAGTRQRVACGVRALAWVTVVARPWAASRRPVAEREE